MPFFCIHISQGSVATCLKRGGIFKHEFIANLPVSRLVQKIENRIIVGEGMAKSLVSCFFLTHGVVRGMLRTTRVCLPNGTSISSADSAQFIRMPNTRGPRYVGHV